MIYIASFWNDLWDPISINLNDSNPPHMNVWDYIKIRRDIACTQVH